MGRYMNSAIAIQKKMTASAMQARGYDQFVLRSTYRETGQEETGYQVDGDADTAGKACQVGRPSTNSDTSTA
jgi:hypothetical protein